MSERPLVGVKPAHGRLVHRVRVQNEVAYRALKRRAIRRAERSGAFGPSSRSAPRTALFNGLSAPGLAASDNSAANLGTPSDSTGAIGPAGYVEFVNSVVGAYSRTDLSLVGSPVQLDDFDASGGTVSGAFTFDPQIEWDESAGRWFYANDLCTDPNCSQDNFLAIGWSQTADPRGMDPTDWCGYFLSSGPLHSPLFDDYPKLGHDDNHLLIGVNTFDGNTFETARIYALSKPPPGDETTCPSAATISASVFGSPSSPLRIANGSRASTPVPANMTDSSAVGYVVAADDPLGDVPGTKGQLMAWQVSGPGNAPSLAAIGGMSVTPYDVPAPAPQPGTLNPNTLDTLDARLTQAVAHVDPGASGQEAVWTQHTVDGPGGRSVDRWYELIPAALIVRQEGTIADPSDFVFNGAISPAANGRDAAIQYNVSGTSQLPEIRAQSQRSGTAFGQMSGELVIATSSNADQDFSCEIAFGGPPCRWGDYSAATPDPADASLVWGTSMTSGPPAGGPPLNDDPAWETENFALAPQGATNALPVAAFAASPNPITAGGTVNFDASASSDPDGPLADFSWDLDGNGSFETDTGTSAVVSHAYAAAGVFAVRLRVRDSRGDTSDAVQNVTVSAPPPTPTPTPVDSTPPVLRLTFKKVQTLWTVLKRGVAGRASCNEACTVRFQLRLPRKVAKGLHIAARFVTVGKLTKRLAANRITSVHIKLSRRARKRLAHVRKVTLRLTAQATDAAGNRGKVVIRSISLKR
jgi:hypothetical protein